jgi:hypothetical protein
MKDIEHGAGEFRADGREMREIQHCASYKAKYLN